MVSFVLAPDDGPAWSVRFGDGRNRVTTGPGVDPAAADAVVRGTSSAVYLWAWNRPADVAVTGDDASSTSGAGSASPERRPGHVLPVTQRHTHCHPRAAPREPP